MRRLLIIGCGDVATRALPALRARYHRYPLTAHRVAAPAKEKSLPQQLVYNSTIAVPSRRTA